MADKIVKVQVMADTSAAKQQLQDLQTQLSSLSSQPINVNDASLVAANKAAIELQQNLQKAMNPNTGKLDLARFSAELSRSQKTLGDYAAALQSIGPQGQQAFLSLSSAIASAEAPTTRLNAKLLKFGNTIKNTINWQISSSIIHGIVGQFNKAINYAEKLNQSLNNIQIITGQSTEHMAEFAKQANAAAQRLSTTTTGYTNASLIYYQQGLKDKEVAARTETTIKLANVSRQSVEEVSSQLTAIWNNYAEGSGNLEHYADVITALGAATASSSSEIATGLEKFAAIGKTVGLSYDYATTALATITAQTRLSAETVGTGLRTLFSRLQSLKLGETLEDGVGLTKYSNALASVGVNIQDQYGKVKDMDQILEELGAKWGTISKEQQIALAQTVGGVRQYTNLIALMDNWDTFQKNLKVAQGSDGTLEKQAEIYSQSWEAASKRVRVAAEGIYDSLIDDQGIIKLLDGFSQFLNLIEGITDGLGGMKGALLMISAILMKNMAKEMPTFLKEMGFGLSTFYNSIRGKPNQDLSNIFSDNRNLLMMRRDSTTDEVEKAQINKILNQQRMNQSLLENQKKMSKEDIAAYQTSMMLAGLSDDARIAQAQQYAKTTRGINEYIDSIAGRYQTKPISSSAIESSPEVQAATKRLLEIQQKSITQEAVAKQYAQLQARRDKIKAEYANRYEVGQRMEKTLGGELGSARGYSYIAQTEAKYAKEISVIESEITKLSGGTEGAISSLDALAEAANNASLALKGEETKAQGEVVTAKQEAETKAINAERIAAEKTARRLYAEGAGISEKEAEKTDLIAFRSNGIPLTFAERQQMANQSAMMTQPLRTAAQKLGNLYGTMDATGSLVKGIEASKELTMSSSQRSAMNTQWSNSIQNIRAQLLENGALTGDSELAKKMLGLTPEALAGMDIDQIVAQIKQIQAQIKTQLTGGTNINEGEELEGSVIGQLNTDINTLEGDTGKVLNLSGEEVSSNITQPLIANARQSTGVALTTNTQGDLAQQTVHLSTTLMSVGSGLMMLNTALQSASNAVQQFGDDTSTGLSRFGAVLSAITTTLMASGMVQNGVNSIAKSIGGAAANAPGWIGLIISAVMASIGIINGIIENREAELKAINDKAIEKSNEVTEKITNISELKSSQETLINAYNQTAQNLKEGLSTQKDLKNAQQELITALNESKEGYSNQNAIAFVLSGNTTQAQQVLDENKLSYLTNNSATVLAGLEGAARNLQAKRGNTGIRYKATTGIYDSGYLPNGSLQWHFNYGASQKDEAQAIKIMDKYSSFKASTSGAAVTITKDLSNGSAAELYAYYKDLVDAFEEMTNAGVTDSSEVYKNVKKQIDYYKDAAEAYGEQKDAIEQLNIERLALGGIVEKQYVGNANEKITDIISYKNYRQSLIDAAKTINNINEGTKEYDDMVKAIDAQLGTISSVINNDLGNLQYIYNGIEGVLEYQDKLRKKQGEALLTDDEKETMTQNLAELYKKYGDAIFDLGTSITIPVDFEDSSSKFSKELELLQAIANKNKILVQLELASDFDLDETSSASAWAAFGKQLDLEAWRKAIGDDFLQFNENGKPIGFNYAKFTSVSDEDQKQYIQKYQDYLNTQLYGEEGIIDEEIAKSEALLLTKKGEKSQHQTTLRTNRNDLYRQIGKTDWRSSPYVSYTEEQQAEIDYLNNLDNFIKTRGQDILQYYQDKKDAATDSEAQQRVLSFEADIRSSGLKVSDFSNEETVTNIIEEQEAISSLGVEISNLQTKIEEGKEAKKAWQEIGFRQGLAAEAALWDINYEEVKKYAEALRETQSWQEAFADAQDNIAEASERAALSILQTEKAIDTIGSKYSDWNNILTSTNSQLKKQAIYKEIAKYLKQLILPTGTVSSEFAEFADNLGLVYRAGQGDKKAILDLGKTLWAYGHINEKTFKEIQKRAEETGDAEQAITDMTKAATEELQTYYEGLADSNGEAATAAKDLEIVTEFLATAQEGQALSAKAQAAAQRLYAAEFKKAIDAGMDAPQALQAASDALNALGMDMPTPEVKTLSTGESTDVSRTDINVVSGGEGDLEYSEGDTTTVTNTSDTDVSYLDWSGKGSGSAQTPDTTKPPKGGGGGGKKKKDHKKPDTGTRYHTIKEKKADNDQKKQETNRQKERAFGAEKIAQAKKEIDLQKEAIELQRQYVDEITDYLAGDRKNMEDAFKGLGISLEIDENGVITNFRQVEEALLKQENALIDKYNNGALDDEAYEEAQKKIDDAREYLKIYEETRNLYEEQMNAMIEMLDTLQDQLLDLTKTKIEIQIDVSDEKLEWLEYMLNKIDDDAYQAAEAIALLGDKTGETLNRIDIYKSGLEEILGRKGFSLDDLENLSDKDLASANFTEAEIQQIRDWKKALMDANQELLDMRENVIDKVIDGFDKLNDKVKDSYNNFNQYNDVLEKYKEITDLLGIRLNQQNKDLLDALGKATLANAQKQAESAKKIYETALAANEKAQATYADIVQRYGENSPEAQQWEKIVNTTQDALDEAQTQWLEAWQNALQIAQDIYTTAIENITHVFEEQVSGLFGSLDYLQSAFDRANQTGDQYLQDFEKLYELNKLNRDIQKEIDDANNIRDKQALRDLQKEINDLQEQGVKLSQYDVDALRKKFELEQARQALEDERNTKSEVRLQRDANGNWGYVYTAAEDDVKEAEQEYENKLYEYQKLNDDYIKELQSRVLETQATYKDALAEIYNDTTLTDEQRQARIDELNAWKDSELAYFEQQLNNALKNQQDTLDLYYKLYGDSQAALADSWQETTLQMLTGADSVEEYINNVQQAMLNMLNESAAALGQYNNDVDNSNEAAGVNTEEYAQHVTQAIADIGEQSETTVEQVSHLADILSDEFTASLEAAVNWEEEYAQKMKDAIEANEKFIQTLNEMIERLTIIESNDPELKIARANYMLAEAQHEKFVKEHGDVYDEDWEKAKKAWEDFISKYNEAATYDTGGYTGSWGTDGRIAILHEKENVFNADDTLRLLNAAEILRSIDLSAQTFAEGLGSLILPRLQNFHDELEQNVHIEASFPNVTEHNEIELAFENLINKASQYANRKNMSSMTFQDMYISKF